MKASEEVK